MLDCFQHLTVSRRYVGVLVEPQVLWRVIKLLFRIIFHQVGMLGADTGYILSSQAKLSKSLRLNQLMWDAASSRLSCCGNSHPSHAQNFHSSRHTLPPSHVQYSRGKDRVLNEK